MKVISFLLGVISLLIWWEAPSFTIGIASINAIMLLKTYDKSFMCKAVIVMSIISVGLAIWNWDYHVGMHIAEKFFG